MPLDNLKLRSNFSSTFLTILCILCFVNFISRTTQFGCYCYFIIVKHDRTNKIHSFYRHYFLDIDARLNRVN